MATSNRDRIGKTFELLAPALDDFIGRSVAAELPAGASWTALVAMKDKKKGIEGKEYHPLDPQVQLRMLTENIPHNLKPGWYPFDDAIGRVGQGYAKELREARNDWAHNKSFSDDDAYRALDTAERLLVAIGAPAVADEVKAIRLGLRRLTADKDDRRTLRSAAATPESAGLRPWREVLPPHDDVSTGNFQAAEFAADLFKVAATQEAGRDYAEPVQFFARTYLTEGLRDLVDRAVRRLAGDRNASPVINLQTNFGGGKTHSMLALWHLASGTPVAEYPQDVQEMLSGTPLAEAVRGVQRVALVGNHLSPSGSVKPEGTQVNTIWGELAWQLGGKEAFARVATADVNRTPPGQALHDLLSAYAPAVILIDEWVAYARSLVGRDDLAGGTFDDQFTFAQALTEAVKGTPGVLLAISIPASESGDDAQPAAGNAEEVGGAHGLEALQRLQNVVRRVADQWRPASPNEAYHIVRQRLFRAPDAEALASINATARGFVEMYHRYDADFPREARGGDYEDRIRQTYPIHPELFDRLYEDWSSLERFQRTRGVLRLMNTVIHALWVGEDQSPLIMPASIPIGTAAVNSELTQYLQDSWKAVIDADVDGPNAEPVKIDAGKPLFGQRSLTRRLARTVFFGAAPTIGSAHKGLETQRVFLGTAIPGDVPGNFHSALAALADRATYFYSAGGRYWYDLQANISRRAKDLAERLHAGDVHAEIARRLKNDHAKTRGAFAGVHVCPEDAADVPDIDEARLVVLHPRLSHKRGAGDSDAAEFAKGASEHRGAANRTYRNMVVYLAGDRDRMEELERSVREYLGWSEIVAREDDLDLTTSQRNQATERRAKASETVDARLLGAYQWALVPTGQPIEIQPTKVEGQSASLAERVSRRLGNDGALAVQHAAPAIRHQLDTAAAKLWAEGHMTVGALWRLYAEYPYMPRLRDRGVLDAGLTSPQLLWEQEGFALADGYDESSGKYRALVLPTDGATVAVTDSTLIVRPERARAQREGELPPDSTPDGVGLDPGVDGGPTPLTVSPPSPGKTRFFGSKRLQPDRYATDFKKLADEVLGPLGATPGAELRVTIEIEATAPDGFDDSKVRTVAENAATLKFEQSGFEES